MSDLGIEEEAIRKRYLNVDSSTLSDLLSKAGRPEQCLSPDLRRMGLQDGKIAGWAYTIRGQMTPYEGAADPDKMRAIEGLSPGQVALWGGATEGVCCFGELLALGMKVRGCVGAVVDGGIRDSHWIGKHGFPLFAKYATPVASTGRWRVTGRQIPLYLPGAVSRTVTVNPGDFVLGDSDGVAVVPKELVLSILFEAEKITERENAIRKEIDAGASLAVVLKRYGQI
jgi:4-hydroxy-4-methyl-2-oxoglutarate aldolase